MNLIVYIYKGLYLFKILLYIMYILEKIVCGSLCVVKVKIIRFIFYFYIGVVECYENCENKK